MNWDDGLGEPHLSIAGSPHRRIGVLAGPGTGKTKYGLMRRVARLLSEGVDPKRILLVSFTRTAARDLRDKIADLGIEGADDARATTLHAFCFGLLQEAAVLAITQRTPRPLLKYETDLMLRDLPGEFGTLPERRQLLEAFDAGWARGTEDHPGNAVLPADKQFEAEAIGWLRHHQAILIGEVVPIAYNYLKNNPQAAALAAFDHVIVDEYQDLNYLEQNLLDLFATPDGAALCVAGDDDQSIYGFRHANPDGILNFVGDPDVEDHHIQTCGRCPARVLAMANALIAHAPGRNKHDLQCLQNDVDGEVAIVQWEDLEQEVDGIVAAIAHDVASERREAGDILVLTHRQKIGEAIRRRLIDLGIDARSFFAEEPLRKPAAREALAHLRLVVGDDPVSVRVLLGLGDGTGRAAAYRKLTDWCRDNSCTEREALDRVRAGEKLAGVPAVLAKHYHHAMTIIEGLPVQDVAALVDALLPEGNEDTQELRDIALEVLPECQTSADLLDAIVVRVSHADVPASPDYVRIMSLHKSKGLTSPAVFVVGMVDGIVPTIIGNVSAQERQLAVDEQRRLTYVALTRAAEQLVLSSAAAMPWAMASALGVRVAKSWKQNGELTVSTIASPYMAELGPAAPNAMKGVAWLKAYVADS